MKDLLWFPIVGILALIIFIGFNFFDKELVRHDKAITLMQEQIKQFDKDLWNLFKDQMSEIPRGVQRQRRKQ